MGPTVPTQTGNVTDDTNQPSSASALQAKIAQEFAALMVAKQRREHRFIKEHHEKRIRAFRNSIPASSQLIHVRQHV